MYTTYDNAFIRIIIITHNTAAAQVIYTYIDRRGFFVPCLRLSRVHVVPESGLPQLFELILFYDVSAVEGNHYVLLFGGKQKKNHASPVHAVQILRFFFFFNLIYNYEHTHDSRMNLRRPFSPPSYTCYRVCAYARRCRYKIVSNDIRLCVSSRRVAS